LPKSIILNYHYFGIAGFKLPILIHYRTILKKVKGNVKINIGIRRGLILFGFTDVATSSGKEWNTWNVEGELIFEGVAQFGKGCSLVVLKSAQLKIGNNFNVTANSDIICANNISFGQDVLISWDVMIMDTDAHPIRDNDMEIINKDKPIIVDDNVWIGSRCVILKGAKISKNSILASNSLLSKPIPEMNVILAGNPAKIVKTNIKWLNENF
jgi:acetyltransferase-like isoleucine patch superfamily enzyme